MSHPEDTTEMTLQTEAESGASGYTVTGGGNQGIFVKQVLKDSSAAKLFSLREGDQLLSATIFFDHMKYEDALKILQYSEPYKVQFRIKRKLSASKGEESAIQHPQKDEKSQEKQDKDMADEYMETPTKTVEADGDQERLISKTRDSRQRQPRERLSWPKFQALRSRRGTGPRRSHSSSEASEHRKACDTSPTSTDTEAQLTAESQEQKSGSGRRRKRLLNLRFGMSSGQGPNKPEQMGREPQERQDHAAVLEETQPQEDETQVPGVVSALTMQMPTKSSYPNMDKKSQGERVGKTDRHQKKKKQLANQQMEKEQSKYRAGADADGKWDDKWEEVESLEIGIARLSLQDTTDKDPLFDVKTASAGHPKKKMKETKKDTKEGGQAEKIWKGAGDKDREEKEVQRASQRKMVHSTVTGQQDKEEGGQKESTEKEDREQEPDTGHGKTTLLKLRVPTIGWSTKKEGRSKKDGRQDRKTIHDDERMDEEKHKYHIHNMEEKYIIDRDKKNKTEHGWRTDVEDKEENIEKESEQATQDIKVNMPKFKMPSFGVSAPGKPSVEASLEVAAPKLEADVSLPSVQGDLKTPDLSIQPPSADLEVKAGQVGVKLPEGQLPEVELATQAAGGAGLKGHLPKVQMPSLKMPKVDLKGPHVDLKGPKVDVKGPKGEVSGPDVEVSLPGVEVDFQAPGAKLEGDLALADKDVAAKDSKFKMPKFKMPSFGVSAPGKPSVEASLEVAAPKLEADVSLPSVQGDLKTPDLSIQPPSADLEVKASQVCPMLPEVTVKGKSRKLIFSMPHLALPKIKGLKGSTVLPQGDVTHSFSSPTAEGDLVVIESTVDDAHLRDTSSNIDCPETFINSSSISAELPESGSDLKVIKGDLEVSGDSKTGMFMSVSSCQPFGELTASVSEPLPLSLREREPSPTVESPKMDPTAKENSKELHDRWFKMPKIRVPVFRRSSSKEQDGSGEQQEATQTKTPVVSIPLDAEVPAASLQLSQVPDSKVEAHVSLGSPEEGASVSTPGSPTYADVVKRDIRGTASRLYISTEAMSQTHLPTPELGPYPVKVSSLEMSGVSISEPRLSPEETAKQQRIRPGGNIFSEVDSKTGSWPSQPQGPLRLKVSLTDMPSQVSVVSTSQLWEDSVSTVTFPKLKVPKFSFHASGSEADVFFPVVREVHCAEASIGSTMHEDDPGPWEASLLKTDAEDPRGPPASLEQSLEAPPISKVKVHIQGPQGENQDVTICSKVEQEGADSSVLGSISTQIVRESEIPASTIQTPFYGFSLLKVKIPKPPVQAYVYTVSPDSQVQEGLGGAPMPAAAGRHGIPGDIPPEAGEPFEMISSSVDMPPLSVTPEVPPGPQLADSASDEEPAEILEFSEDSQEVKTPEIATRQKPEGKKSSLLWSWLPSIGFSSVEETATDSRDTTQRPAPVHVQPAARLDPELPRKQEKSGWFRFPKLGFSSSPIKKSRDTEDVEGQAEQKPQEETITFFDAQESFSPEEEDEAEPEVTRARPISKAMVASSARTELVLLEQARDTSDKSHPGL